MPASWPAEALKAQAVVARSYALRSLRPSSAYDVFADVRSQVYNGVAAETSATTAAVRSTRARVVRAGGDVAQTFFFSTSGGRTASNEGLRRDAALLPALGRRSARRFIAHHAWTAAFTEREANRGCAGLLGDLREHRRRQPHPSGRAATVAGAPAAAATGPSRRRPSDAARPAQHLDHVVHGRPKGI